ncbi:MAG: 5-formyltetrahydrofolate cyclo-ligase [Oscillibacter sp.]|jgi:5-formyltetrahydrofolate cyclo-ligase|nr:5-formyltetrahydrofolate cyclo-ligase [Oscillibacter sp.]
MTRADEKKQLRSEVRAAMRQMDEGYAARADKAIAATILKLPEYQSAGTVFCFATFGREINTHPILEDALRAGKRLCVPLCTGMGLMELHIITSLSQLTPGSYNIPEPPAESPTVTPDEVDFAVIPCLSCDHAGRRLGRGGGFYDRFLADYRSGAVMVCRERLIREELPVEPHDRPVHWVVTENGLYEDGTPARIE